MTTVTPSAWLEDALGGDARVSYGCTINCARSAAMRPQPYSMARLSASMFTDSVTSSGWLRGSSSRRASLVLGRRARSEEHTSELQSLMRISYAVFCLKKKQQSTTQ